VSHAALDNSGGPLGVAHGGHEPGISREGYRGAMPQLVGKACRSQLPANIIRHRLGLFQCLWRPRAR
jgi:hypothetical protein